MSNNSAEQTQAKQAFVIKKSDLPLSCPPPGAEVWNMHPRVYLPIETSPNKRITCPYCGAEYRLED